MIILQTHQSLQSIDSPILSFPVMSLLFLLSSLSSFNAIINLYKHVLAQALNSFAYYCSGYSSGKLQLCLIPTAPAEHAWRESYNQANCSDFKFMAPNLHAAGQSHCFLQVLPFSKPITLIPTLLRKLKTRKRAPTAPATPTHFLSTFVLTPSLFLGHRWTSAPALPIVLAISFLLIYSDCSSHSSLAYIINFLLYSESFPLTITCHYFFFLSPLLSSHALLTTTSTSLSFYSKLKSCLFLLSWSLLPFPLKCIPVSLPIPPFYQNCYWQGLG